MKLTKALVAALLALSLTGASTPPPTIVHPDEPRPGHGANGPTCYGANGWYHVWNLFAPQDVIMVDSCVAATLIAYRDIAGNYVLYVSLVTAKVPFVFPVALYAMAWQTGNHQMRVCASKGTGIEFVQDSKTGMVLGCRAQ
jgi:putative hemolysin